MINLDVVSRWPSNVVLDLRDVVDRDSRGRRNGGTLPSWLTSIRGIEPQQRSGTHSIHPGSVLQPGGVLPAATLFATIILDLLDDPSVPRVFATSGLAALHAAAASASWRLAQGQINLDHAVAGLIAFFTADSLIKRAVAGAHGGKTNARPLTPRKAIMLLLLAATLSLT